MEHKICISKRILFVTIFISVIGTLIVLSSYFILTKKSTYKSRAEAPNMSQNVYGGTNAEKGRWPFMAKLFYNFGDNAPYVGGICDGTLIAPQWIVTAAHCVRAEDALLISVFLGSEDLSLSDANYVYRVEKIIQHPKFGVNSDNVAVNDIALIKLDRQVVSTKPIRINTDIAFENEGQKAVVVGWGRSNNPPSSGEPALYLQQGVLPILSSARVQKWDEIYKNNANISKIITGYPNGGVGMCDGDSGGPILTWNRTQWVQLGIVSWRPVKVGSEECAFKKRPDVNVRLSYKGTDISNANVPYIDWIDTTIKSNGGKDSNLGLSKNDSDYFVGTPLSVEESTQFKKRVCDKTEWDNTLPVPESFCLNYQGR